MCKGLSKQGVEVHVLTIAISKLIPNDFGLLSQVPESVIVHRIPIIDPWLKYDDWKHKSKITPGFRLFNKILSILFQFITLPDHQILWVSAALRAARKILKKNAIGTVLITSPPISTHLVGWRLKKSGDANWIADMRDPIAGNTFQSIMTKRLDLFSKIQRVIACKMERLICDHADRVTVTSDIHRKDLETRYKISKFVTARNSFDEEDYIGLDHKDYEKFTIAHLGSMYGPRKADVLFKAIKILEHKIGPNNLKIQFLFIGLNDNGLQRTISKYGVERYVKNQSLVPHQKAIEVMLSSHLLLLIKASEKGAYGQIPAKFFEYLGAKKKIICIGPEESEVAQIIRKIDAGFICDDDSSALSDFLEKEYNSFISGIDNKIESPILENYSLCNLGKIIEKSLIELNI
jgi:hypothetical protein